jgi:hypothetical protein
MGFRQIYGRSVLVGLWQEWFNQLLISKFRVSRITLSRIFLTKIFSDNVHLTAIGQLYVGAFSYSEIFGQPPSGFTVPGNVSQETGEALLEMAWSLTQEYRARGNSHSHDMAACRDHISNNICEPFWTYFFGRDKMVSRCLSFFGNENADNPFTNDMSNSKV